MSAAADVEGVLDQIDYLADELESLASLIGRVPGAILVASPLGDGLSIADTFAERFRLDERRVALLRDGRFHDGEEWRATKQAATSDPNESRATADKLPGRLRESAVLRRRLVSLLREAVEGSGNESLTETMARLYDIVHEDARVLQEVSRMLYGIPVTRRDKLREE